MFILENYKTPIIVLIILIISFIIFITIYENFEPFVDGENEDGENEDKEKDRLDLQTDKKLKVKNKYDRDELIKKYVKKKKSISYLSINVLIDITERINMIKTILSDTEVKLNYDIAILNETKSISSGQGYIDQMETLNSKVARLESYKSDINDKMVKIDEMKDNIYQKIPEELIVKIEKIAEINIQHKNLYKDIMEITSKSSFTEIKKEIKTELEELDEQIKDLRTILMDIIIRFY